MNGTYILVIELSDREAVKIGKLGTIKFKNGYYAYVGSALNGLEQRINRHLRDDKKLFWHIDHLLDNAKANICEIYYKCSETREECDIAEMLAQDLPMVPNFGSSDCKCKSHLFYSKDHMRLHDAVKRGGMTRFMYNESSE